MKFQLKNYFFLRHIVGTISTPTQTSQQIIKQTNKTNEKSKLLYLLRILIIQNFK